MQFHEFELSKETQRAVKEMGFEETTPIQALSIPAILKGKDIIGQAQTGTGKTCAFAIPAIEMLDSDSQSVQVLVLCPTRELVIQSAEEFKSVAKFKEGVRILPIYGGQSIDRQIMGLKKRPQIIIGTPGRLMDHMRRATIKLDNIKLVVLDEADEMLSMGFQEDIDTILQKTSKERQTVLFSATMSERIMDIAKNYQKQPELIEIYHKELTVPGIDQYYLEVRDAFRLDVLTRLIDGFNFNICLVFCNTKMRVDQVVSELQTRGYLANALHGDMRQNERDAVMARFRNGEINILVATDVAARGIDVDNIDAVINYDVPNDEEYYVHRIGRTGRAGRTGKAYTFISGREYYRLKEIQRYAKTTIRQIQPPTLFDIEESKTAMLLKKVIDTIEDDDYSKYSTYIDQVAAEINTTRAGKHNITSMDIASAMLKILADSGDKKYKNSSHENETVLSVEKRYRNDRQNMKNKSGKTKQYKHKKY